MDQQAFILEPLSATILIEISRKNLHSHTNRQLEEYSKDHLWINRVGQCHSLSLRSGRLKTSTNSISSLRLLVVVLKRTAANSNAPRRVRVPSSGCPGTDRWTRRYPNESTLAAERCPRRAVFVVANKEILLKNRTRLHPIAAKQFWLVFSFLD